MGLFKFRLPPSFPDISDLEQAYVTGQDRTPSHVRVDVRDDVLTVHRETTESGRIFVPWPVAGYGRPFVGTATLAERPQPYNLAVELARGKINDIRNQLADWKQLGLKVPAEADRHLDSARKSFARAATSQDRPEASAQFSGTTLTHTFAAGRRLVEAYTEQVLRTRLEHAPRLPTSLGVTLEGNPKSFPWSNAIFEAFNSARVACNWKTLAPDEGSFRWEQPDAQIQWYRKRKVAVSAGPIIDLRPGALPDWLWLWQGDYDEVQAQALDVVKQAVTRYKGKVSRWHVLARAGSRDILGLSEEAQIRLAARIVQEARQADPDAQIVVDFDRPWAEWLASGSFQLGPLHLADSLARSEIGLGGIGLEIAPGYDGFGSRLRDLFEFSRLLDLYALVGLPLHLSMAFPSAPGADAKAVESVSVVDSQWPAVPDEALQREWAARWIALAVAKPFVRSVTWMHASDAQSHVFPHAGLLRADGHPKPLFGWLKRFRGEFLG
jgi:hypothetical protein